MTKLEKLFDKFTNKAGERVSVAIIVPTDGGYELKCNLSTGKSKEGRQLRSIHTTIEDAQLTVNNLVKQHPSTNRYVLLVEDFR